MAHEHIVYMMLVDSAVRAGDETTIRRYVPKLEELALRDDHRPYLAVAHRAWGVAHRLSGEYQEAETRLEKALEIFEELGTRWQIGRTLFGLGELAMAKLWANAAPAIIPRTNTAASPSPSPDMNNCRPGHPPARAKARPASTIPPKFRR